MQNNNPGPTPIRILHLSDFHLNGEKIKDAQHVLDNMIKSLQDINSEQQIDLVIFSGDMLEQGGVGYNHDLKQGFVDFQTRVISPILKSLNLSAERFIFTPGNHDVNREADKKPLEEYCNNHSNDYTEIVNLLKDDELSDLKKCDEFKSFEESYYKNCSNIVYKCGKYTSTFELGINGYSIGISSLNSVWHCGIVPGTPLMGVCQIKENTQHLENKDIKIAISHFPCYKLEKEYSQVINSLANNFDMFFSGHTHSGVSQFISLNRRDYFLDINSGGTLAANTYENDAEYKNAFQIVDYWPRLKYQVRRMVQINSQEFELDRNGHYAPDGILEHTIPLNEKDLIRIYEETLKLHEQQRTYIFKSKILPFVPFKDFIERPNNKVMEGDFIPITKFDYIKDKLLNGNESSIRIMALPGMGKTRIVAEAFRQENNNVYYSREDDCENGLSFLLTECSSPIIIIDNCRIEQLAKIKKIVSEFGKEVRIISIYNILTTNEKGVGLGLYVLGYEDTKPVVDAMIELDSLVSANEVIKNTIKRYSGNIPLMAKLLIEAFRKTSTLNIENPDLILQHFIRNSETQNNYKTEILRAISLFEPLGYDGNLQDEFDFLVNCNTIHRINENIDIVCNLFHITIEDFEKRELIEHAGGCIRIRPIPLAEWLTSQWIQQNSVHFSELFRQIQNQPESLGKRLADALKRRFEGMIHNPQAKQLFDSLNNPNNGSFHDERIAFSEMGSRLFLSMGTVSPIMVAKNIHSLLEIRKNDRDWLVDNISDEVRRNLVYTLERIAFLSADAFPSVAESLLLLSSAENETYSNNSTGLFIQLFHILLGGTNAPLSIRIKTLEENYAKPQYTSVIINAIDAAFKSEHFSWIDTSGISHFPTKTCNDYCPPLPEVHDYCDKCSDILIKISNQTPDYDSTIKKVIDGHVFDIYNINGKDIMAKLLTYYGEKSNYDWPEIRKTLRYNIKYWSKDNEDRVRDSMLWYNKFAPKTFFLRLKDTVDEGYLEERKNHEQLDTTMYELMAPYAKEFLDNKIYMTDEMRLMLQDWELQGHWFIQKVVKNAEGNTNCIKEILDSLILYVEKEDSTFESPFITQFCIELTRERKISLIDLEKNFLEKLYGRKYYRLSATIEGIIDDEKHLLLANVIKKANDGIYDNDCLNRYLNRYCWQYMLDSVLSITDELLSAGIDEDEVVYPYFTDRLLVNNIKEINDDKVLGKIEDILLRYTFTGKSSHIAHQVVEVIGDILELHDRPKFAISVHNKAVSVLTSNRKTPQNPFSKIYDTLLPKYQDAILEQLCKDIASEGQGSRFIWEMQHYLGSGFGDGMGPLFKCDYNRLKQLCLQYHKTLPYRMAQMCPVIENGKDPQETFFWWLCDNFGNVPDVLSAFCANMGTYFYSGPALASFADLIAKREDILKPYLQHPNFTVREWAKRQIESLHKEVKAEKDNEEYSKMINYR